MPEVKLTLSRKPVMKKPSVLPPPPWKTDHRPLPAPKAGEKR